MFDHDYISEHFKITFLYSYIELTFFSVKNIKVNNNERHIPLI